MTKEEKQMVDHFLKMVFDRINKAKSEIRACNYGQALKTLSDAYPPFKIVVDEEKGRG